MDSDPLLSSAGIIISYDEDTNITFNDWTAYSLVSRSDCRHPTVDGTLEGTGACFLSI